MSPFREPPAVELGPLAVGLRRAARRALSGVLPSGGRVRSPAPRRASHVIGALGSLGLLLVAAWALMARAAGWMPVGLLGTAATVALVIAGGLSLALVLRALDAPREERPTVRGELVAQAARRALCRAARLAEIAERAPARFGPRQVAALRDARRMLSAPQVAAWIPADVRGRTELLLARTLAATAGPRWSEDERLRGEVRALLLSAAEHLAEPAPAESDLVALGALHGAERRRIAASPARAGAGGGGADRTGGEPDRSEEAAEAEAEAEAEADLRASAAARG